MKIRNTDSLSTLQKKPCSTSSNMKVWGTLSVQIISAREMVNVEVLTTTRKQTLLVWHALDASQNADDIFKEVIVAANDTAILVILITFAEKLCNNTFC